MSTTKTNRRKSHASDRHSQRAQRLDSAAKQTRQRLAAEETERQARAKAEFESLITTTRLKMAMATTGEDATEILAALAVVIGTSCQGGAATVGREPWVRQLHGALRTIQNLCLNNRYQWDSSAEPALDKALTLAAEKSETLPTHALKNAWQRAVGFAAIINSHQVDANDIAGTDTTAKDTTP